MAYLWPKLFRMKSNLGTNQLLKGWKKLPLIIRAIFSGFLVSTIGIAAWSAILFGFTLPWSILPMIFVLWVYWKFFSGRWGTKKSGVVKRENFRSAKIIPSNWKWALAGAISFVFIVQASFFIPFRIIKYIIRYTGL
jgi:hypothetical protein